MKKILYLAMLPLLVACTEKMDIDLNKNEHKRVIVEAQFTDQLKEHEVRLTFTDDYFANVNPEFVDGAQVTLTDGTKVWSLDQGDDHIYRTPEIKGEIGKTYELEIKYDEEVYKASSYMDDITVIDSIGYVYDEEDEEYEIMMWGQETVGEGDYYLWHLYKNDTIQTDTLSEAIWADDVFVEGNYIAEFPLYDIEAKDGDKIRLEIWSIPREVNDFFYAVMNQGDWRGGPFDTPPANVPTNFSGGALGFFYASAVSANETIIREETED